MYRVKRYKTGKEKKYKNEKKEGRQSKKMSRKQKYEKIFYVKLKQKYNLIKSGNQCINNNKKEYD